MSPLSFCKVCALRHLAWTFQNYLREHPSYRFKYSSMPGSPNWSSESKGKSRHLRGPNLRLHPSQALLKEKRLVLPAQEQKSINWIYCTPQIVTVTARTFLVGNPNLNFHLPLSPLFYEREDICFFLLVLWIRKTQENPSTEVSSLGPWFQPQFHPPSQSTCAEKTLVEDFERCKFFGSSWGGEEPGIHVGWQQMCRNWWLSQRNCIMIQL